MILPAEALPLLAALAPAFTRPTFRRFVILLGAAILTTGRRTVANLLRTAAPLAPGHRTSYQRVLSSAAWSALHLACGLCRLVLRPAPRRPAVILVGDDTVDGHPGRRSTARPATATRSAPATATPPGGTATSGSSWPCWSASPSPPAPGPCRCWWPCTAPRRTTGARAARTAPRPSSCATLLRVLLLWFPDRRFVFVGDAGYGTHEVARFAHRHRARLTPGQQAPPRGQPVRAAPAVLGQGPAAGQGAAAAQAARRRSAGRRGCGPRTVAWYGGGTRRGRGRSPARGTGTRRARAWCRSAGCSSATGPARTATSTSSPPTRRMTPAAMIEAYTGRWNIETTFQELRCLPRAGDDAGLVPADGAAGGAVPVRAVHGGGAAVPGAARVEAVGAGGVAGQGGRDVLRRPDLRCGAGCGGSGFFHRPGGGRGRRKTPRAAARGPVLRPRTGGVAPERIGISRAQLIRPHARTVGRS